MKNAQFTVSTVLLSGMVGEMNVPLGGLDSWS